MIEKSQRMEHGNPAHLNKQAKNGNFKVYHITQISKRRDRDILESKIWEQRNICINYLREQNTVHDNMHDDKT
jgi:hypothetical protein